MSSVDSDGGWSPRGRALWARLRRVETGWWASLIGLAVVALAALLP